MSSVATFCDVPISTAFDSHAATSCVSLAWVINSGLRTRNSQASGVLTLPCNTGVISMVLNNIPVAASPASDLLLGLDWLDFATSLAPELVVYLDSGVSLDLRRTTLSTSAIVSGASPLTATLTVVPVSRGSASVDSSSSPSTTLGGPGAVSTPSSMPCPQGVGVVGVSPARFSARLEEAQSSVISNLIPNQPCDRITPSAAEVHPLHGLAGGSGYRETCGIPSFAWDDQYSHGITLDGKQFEIIPRAEHIVKREASRLNQASTGGLRESGQGHGLPSPRTRPRDLGGGAKSEALRRVAEEKAQKAATDQEAVKSIIISRAFEGIQQKGESGEDRIRRTKTMAGRVKAEESIVLTSGDVPNEGKPCAVNDASRAEEIAKHGTANLDSTDIGR
ncbi:hypothetical protein FB451DRAFT_1374177 [Mycena latifolia]|nr:hypothetical protein FB451DRAFT_1374177 [Mycena latifolia]